MDLPAEDALLILEHVLKTAEIEGYKHQQLIYAAKLPLYVNSEELPEPPEPPEWLAELIED